MAETLKKGADDQLIIETAENVVKQAVFTLDHLKEQKEMWVKTKQQAQEHIDHLNTLITAAKNMGVLTADELKAKQIQEEEAAKP